MLAGITADDLRVTATEMEGGSGSSTALANRPGVRKLVQTMESVSSCATRTIFNKRSLRMKAISMIMQLGQPLFWMAINPNDQTSPIVMKLGGMDLDVWLRAVPRGPVFIRVHAVVPFRFTLFRHRHTSHTYLRFTHTRARSLKQMRKQSWHRPRQSTMDQFLVLGRGYKQRGYRQLLIN